MVAIDEGIHLDGLYFLMRRQPDTMLGMLYLHQEVTPSSAFHTTNRKYDEDPGTDSSTNSETGTIDHKNDNNHFVSSTNNTNNAMLRRSTRKRKQMVH